MKMLYIRKDGVLKEQDVDPSSTFYEENDGYHVVDESGVYRDQNGENPICIIKSGKTICVGAENGEEAVERSVHASRIGKYMDVSGQGVGSVNWGNRIKSFVKYGLYLLVFGLVAYAVLGDILGFA